MKSRYLFLLLLFAFVMEAKEIKVVAFYTKNIAKVSNKDVQIAIHNILREGSRKSGIELKEVFPVSVEAIIDGFITGEYSLITLNTYDVMQNYERIEPYIGKMWTIAKKKDSPKMRYLLLVKKNRAGDTALMQGGSVAMLNFDYMQNIYLDSYLFENYHKSAKEFFKNIETFQTSSQVILKLFFSKVDACIVSEHAYEVATELNPQLKSKIEILAASDKIFPSVGLTISRKGDNKMAELYSVFTYDKKDIKTLSHVLMLYKAEAIVYFSQKSMEDLRHFYEHYLALKAKYE